MYEFGEIVIIIILLLTVSFGETDNGYTTIFRYSDIAKKYLNSDSDILLIFLDDNGKYIDEKIFKVHNSVNTFIIDSKIVPDNRFWLFFLRLYYPKIF